MNTVQRLVTKENHVSFKPSKYLGYLGVDVRSVNDVRQHELLNNTFLMKTHSPLPVALDHVGSLSQRHWMTTPRKQLVIGQKGKLQVKNVPLRK